MKLQHLLPLFLAPALLAEEATIDMEARRQNVIDLRKRIEQREQRLEDLVGDIRRLDERTEKRVDNIIDELSRLTDSQSSRTRVTRLKGDVISGLKSAIGAYSARRHKTLERLRTQKGAPADALQADVDRIDARIQKRVDQIMALAESMPTRQDVEKYESDGETYFNGWHWETTRISEEWRQNRRQGTATENERRALTSALEDAISDLERRRHTVANRLNQPNLNAHRKELLEHELGRIDALLDHRRRELANLSRPSNPEVEPTDRDSADHLRRTFDSARDDISSDHWTLLRKYDEAIKERDEILGLKKTLAAREAWLKEHDKED